MNLHHFTLTLWTECDRFLSFSHIFSRKKKKNESHQTKRSYLSWMEIPRKYHFSPILSLILLSLIIVVLVLRSRQLLEFAPIATGSKPPYSVPLDRLRTKLSGENPLHAVGNSGELRRNKFRNRTATVSSTVFYFISLCLFRWFCFDELINFRAFRNSRFCCVNLDSVFLFSVCFFLWLCEKESKWISELIINYE